MSAESPLLRFVVLFHEGIADPHFDLMFELEPGGGLATWRSPRWPIDQETSLTTLPAHRAAYLEFEGDLSGNRGQVRRIVGGVYRRDENWTIHFIEPENLRSIKIDSLAAGTWRANLV